MERVHFKTKDNNRTYDDIIDADVLEKCGEFIRSVIKPCRVMLVTDKTVGDIYLDLAESSLRDAGFTTYHVVLASQSSSHEDLKSLSNCEKILDAMAACKLDRHDCALALGGGTIGDITGLAAALYMRGIRYVQIPTTLLAMIDASVGGKTAVNITAGKNLAGAFWQPSLVLCDWSLLKTLPIDEMLNGIAEGIKYGMIGNTEILQLLQDNDLSQSDNPLIGSFIHKCVAAKAIYVAEDETDTGARRLLNFGHTIGHSIECLSSYCIPHGRAVAFGMLIVCKAMAARGLMDRGGLEILQGILEKYGLIIDAEYSPDVIVAASVDKKRKGDITEIVTVTRPGEVQTLSLDDSELVGFIKDGLNYGY